MASQKPGFLGESLYSLYTYRARALFFDAVNARWDEIDLDAAEWTIPAERFKTRREHIIPLSSQAVELLRALPRENEWVFPSNQKNRAGYPLSAAAMLATLKRKGLAATVHGFRSTYREWADDIAKIPDDLSEHVLGHVVAGKAKKAYKRSSMFDRRVGVMQDWANFLYTNV
jgi:integrase